MPTILIFIAVYVLGVLYIGRRLIRPMRVTPRAKRRLSILLALAGAGVLASVVLSRVFESWSTALSWFAYPTLGLFSSLFFLLLLRDLGLLVTRMAQRLRRRRARAAKPEPVVDLARRAHLQQITNLGVLSAAGAVTSYGIFEARRTPGIVEISVPIPNLPPAFEGFRIVQITDVHAGLTVGREWIEMVTFEAQALRPDMIAFTGDIADGSVPHLSDAVAPLAELRAPSGKFFVTGNHEYYSGVEPWVAHVGRLGFDTLMNEHRLIERGGARLALAGVTDFTGGQFLRSHVSDPAAALRNAPDDLVRIFLAHQPKTIRQTKGLRFDLMLSGHTHGGQLFPWNLLTAVDQPYVSGLHRDDGRWVYVSKGTGYWGPPVRLGARSEITVITLTRNPATLGA